MATLRAALVLALGLALPGPAGASPLLDFVTFDGIDYIRWAEEPGRALTPGDLGAEFAAVACSIGEDNRGCPYGSDAGAAFMPAGTRIYAVRGYTTDFRLAAVWKDQIFLYQAWRNPRAKTGADLFDLAGKVRAIDVERGEPPGGRARRPTPLAPQDAELALEMLVRAVARRPVPHAVGEPRYWLTLWFADGTSLGRPYYTETREIMGGLVVPAEFGQILDRYLEK